MSDFITNIDILEESKDCFLTYAEEVLTDRAIPSAEDGLLSVHRKLLWTMEDLLKLNNKSKYKKSASIVGSTLASSYFHGDSSCYGAMCKMAQAYLMRYPLVDGDGNFGTQEGNGMEAASRYTNAKPSKYADLMFNDFKKDVVPLKETYNGEYMEPVVLPSLFPNAIVNGKESIGISMSHCSMPHCLSEVCDGIIAYINNPNLTVSELMQYIKGPDFPLGGTVINARDIKTAFETGHSAVSLKVRGDYEIKGQTITFTSIPYRTYRNKIKEQINKNIEELDKYIEDFSDLSNVGKNKLVFKVKKEINPEQALLKLFALTDLQTSLSYNMNFIVDGTPKLCSMIDLISAYVKHQHNILTRSAEFDKNKAEERIHILKGLILAVDKINEVIDLIKKSKDKVEACNNIINFLSVDSIQANAILDMKLSRLTKINKEELLDELDKKINLVKECKKIISDKEYRDSILINKITDLKNKYGDQRRTELTDIIIKPEEKEIAEVIPEDVVVILSQSGNIKRIPIKSFKLQRKGGKGVKTADEATLETISTNTIDTLLFFSNKGKLYRTIVNNIPVGTNMSKGSNINSLIKLDSNEKIISMISLNNKIDAKYAVFFTKKGMVKKTNLEEYTKIKRNNGIQAIKLNADDSIANVTFLNEEEVIVITKLGQAIHFPTKEISAIGRVTLGVKAIKLKDGDEILCGLPISDSNKMVSIITKDGLGKKNSIADFPIQSRGGIGVKCSDSQIAGAAIVDDDDSLLLIGENSLCISVKDLPKINRIGKGNIIKKGAISKVLKL